MFAAGGGGKRLREAVRGDGRLQGGESRSRCLPWAAGARQPHMAATTRQSTQVYTIIGKIPPGGGDGQLRSLTKRLQDTRYTSGLLALPSLD